MKSLNGRWHHGCRLIEKGLGKVVPRAFSPSAPLYHFSPRALGYCLEKAGLTPVLWALEPPSAGSFKKTLGYLILKAIEKITLGAWPGVSFSLAVFAKKR
jgi:hypothetical protein